MSRVLAVALCAVVSLSARAAPAEKAPEKPAEKAPAKAPTPTVEDLTTAARVKEVCLATRPAERVLFTGDEVAKAEDKATYGAAREAAMQRLYRARIAADGFRLGEYRTRDGALLLDLTRSLRSLHGALQVSLPSTSDVAFPLTPEAAKGALGAAKAGTATVDAYFELDDETGIVCAGNLAAGVFNVQAVPVAFELRDGVGQLLARTETPLADKHRAILGGYSGIPTAVVGQVTAPGDIDARALLKRLEGIGDPVRRCYARRLEERPNTAGTLILAVEVGADGKVGSIELTADAVGDEPARACVEDAVKAVRFNGISGLPTLFRVPVELKLVPR